MDCGSYVTRLMRTLSHALNQISSGTFNPYKCQFRHLLTQKMSSKSRRIVFHFLDPLNKDKESHNNTKNISKLRLFSLKTTCQLFPQAVSRCDIGVPASTHRQHVKHVWMIIFALTVSYIGISPLLTINHLLWGQHFEQF